MASLRDTVKDYQDELRDGIAWVTFWKTGRSWNAEYTYLEMDDTIPPLDKSRLEEIRRTAPAAVTLNGYYCGHFGEDMNLDELTAGVRWHYENGYNLLSDFLEAHDDRIPPEVIEEARAAAHAAGLPFSEKPYRDGEEADPYIFDGSMSIEDYELMHRLINEERSGHMEEFTYLEAYISNLGKYAEGRPAGEWVRFPTTAEQMKKVFDRIGIDGTNYEAWHITEYHSDIPGLAQHLSEHEHLDELNYLSELLKMQDDGDREKFTAAMEFGDHAGSVKELINLAQNLDCYWLYPSVTNEEEYGYYLIDELDELELPEEAKKYFMYEDFGRDAAINDGGRFTEQGYIYNNRNTFTEWYNGRESDIPKEYRIVPQLPKQERPDPEKEDFEAAAALAPEPRPVVPIIPVSSKPDEKLKEITDRLEQGISELFESERYTDYLHVMSKFPQYSLRNTVLIAMQAPDATHVMGFDAWKDPAIGRYVKAEQKGIRIIAPRKAKKKVEKIDPDTQKPVLDKDGKPVIEEIEISIPKFRVVCVYDIAQTDGRELPTLTTELTGNVEQYRDFFAALERTSPFTIGFEPLGSANGRCLYEEQRIAINEGMGELQNIKTAIHEIAHATLHDTAIDTPERPDRRTREIQAESIAYTVCKHYGLDTSDYSFGYITGWSSGRELTELQSSLELIRSTAANLIETIDGHLSEIQKEQTQEQAQEQKQPEAVNEPQETAEPEQTGEAPEAAPQEPETVEAAPQEQPEPNRDTPGEPQEPEQPAAPYYSINETAARRAKDMNSFSDYKPGSATAEYRHYVDEAVQLAEQQKKRVDPMYHEKIDSLLDTYARKLAANMNKGYEIDARVPSILIAGGSNFPVRKKEKQNAARDRNMEEWRDIQGLLDKIRSTGMGGISADDPQAVKKLESKLASLEKSQETMKAVNAYYRKHKTLDGCPDVSPEQGKKLIVGMASYDRAPYPSWALSNNSAEIRRVKDRIKSLSRQKEIGFVGWEFEGGKAEANTEVNRLQIFFDGKPDEAAREALKGNGFRWSPKAGAWQRQLTDNAYYAADRISAIAPLSGEKPTDILRAHIRAAKEKPQQPPQEYIYQIHTNPRSDSRENLCFLQAYLPQEDGKAKIGDVLYTGTPEKCRELMGQLNSGELTQAQVKELYAKSQEPPQPEKQSDGQEKPAQEPLSPDELTTGEKVKTPRGTFYVTDMTAEQMKEAGYGLHHTSDDGKYLVMGNGTRAFAIAAEQPQRENPLKAAEQTTEQNENMIDGIINNEPPKSTARELEAKAMAGEQISLADYAAALKQEKEHGSKDKPEKKPSIRAQLKADKAKTAPKKAAAKSKNQEMEV